MATNWVTAKVIENRKLTDRHLNHKLGHISAEQYY